MTPSSSSTDSVNVIQSSVFQNPLKSIEIALSTKRKLGFIKGTVLRSLDDHVLKEQWDTCNNMVISWLISGIKTTALYSKSETKEKCFICGYKWHPEDKCWEKVGYPAWHYKSKQSQQKGKTKATGTNAPPKRTAAVVESGNVVFTSKQFKQLMKSLPYFNVQNLNKGGDLDEELDHHFAAGLGH
ncbi:hypothetical protein Tco_0333566 [Tanacetum coccineum]